MKLYAQAVDVIHSLHVVNYIDPIILIVLSP